jgi:hypothetical protein
MSCWSGCRLARRIIDAVPIASDQHVVLFMTKFARDAIVHCGRLDVGVSMLQKPLTLAALAAKIRHLLDQPQTAPALSP